MRSERSSSPATSAMAMKNTTMLRWVATALAAITGIINFYYGNTYAGFYENLWYIMGGIYILAAILLAANELPRFVQPAMFGYALFLISLWAVGAATAGAGLDVVAYLDKAVEVILAISMAFLIRDSRAMT